MAFRMLVYGKKIRKPTLHCPFALRFLVWDKGSHGGFLSNLV